MKIPLLDPNATNVDGHVSFETSQLTVNAMPDMPIQNINGQLFFNNDGVNAEAITATFLDRPTKIDVIPGTESTLVTAKGEISIQQLAQLWQEQNAWFCKRHDTVSG